MGIEPLTPLPAGFLFCLGDIITIRYHLSHHSLPSETGITSISLASDFNLASSPHHPWHLSSSHHHPDTSVKSTNQISPHPFHAPHQLNINISSILHILVQIKRSHHTNTNLVLGRLTSHNLNKLTPQPAPTAVVHCPCPWDSAWINFHHQIPVDVAQWVWLVNWLHGCGLRHG